MGGRWKRTATIHVIKYAALTITRILPFFNFTYQSILGYSFSDLPSLVSTLNTSFSSANHEILTTHPTSPTLASHDNDASFCSCLYFWGPIPLLTESLHRNSRSCSRRSIRLWHSTCLQTTVTTGLTNLPNHFTGSTGTYGELLWPKDWLLAINCHENNVLLGDNWILFVAFHRFKTLRIRLESYFALRAP